MPTVKQLSPYAVASLLGDSTRIDGRIATQAIHSIRTSNLYYGTTGLANTDRSSVQGNVDDLSAQARADLPAEVRATLTAQGVNKSCEQLLKLYSLTLTRSIGVAKASEQLLKIANRIKSRSGIQPAPDPQPPSQSPADQFDLKRAESILSTLTEVYKPGVRTISALHDEKAQMMDFYYGDKSQIFRRRDLAVAEVLHKLLEFNGPFNPNVSGREAYLNSVSDKSKEGWDKDCEFTYQIIDPEESESPFVGSNNKPLQHYTVTQAMSWFFRHMVRVHGGAIYFEGSNIAYDAVFTQTPRGVSDSQLEIFRLFKYMNSSSANSGSDFKMGQGNLIFTLGNQPTTPTKAIFSAYWKYDHGKLPAAFAPEPGQPDPTAKGTNHLWDRFA